MTAGATTVAPCSAVRTLARLAAAAVCPDSCQLISWTVSTERCFSDWLHVRHVDHLFNEMLCVGAPAHWPTLSRCVIFALFSTYADDTFMSSSYLLSARCHQLSVPRVRHRTFGTLHFRSPDQQSGIHCLVVCGSSLLTPNNLGGKKKTKTYLFSRHFRSVSALEVFT